MVGGDYFVDSPVYIKSGVTLSGSSGESCEVCTHMLAYEGSNNGNTEEDGIVVIDGVIDAEVSGKPTQQYGRETGSYSFCEWP